MSETTIDDTLQTLNKFQQKKITSPKQLFLINSSFEDVEVRRLIGDLKNLTPTATNTKEQGALMENLVKYLVQNCGFLVEDEHGQKNKQQELDHTAEFSLHVRDYLKGKGMERFSFLGESKNYPSGKLDVNIVYKVEALKIFIEAGVAGYFCRKGLTGNELTAAHTLVKDFHNRFKSTSLVFTDDDWDFLENNPQKFGDVFYEKLKRFINMYDWVLDYTTL